MGRRGVPQAPSDRIKLKPSEMQDGTQSSDDLPGTAHKHIDS